MNEETRRVYVRTDIPYKIWEVLLTPSKAGGYAAEVPDLPGCYSQGETVEETLANICVAIELYMAEREDSHRLAIRDHEAAIEVLFQEHGVRIEDKLAALRRSDGNYLVWLGNGKVAVGYPKASGSGEAARYSDDLRE